MGRIATHAAIVCVYARYCYCLAEKHSTPDQTGVVQSVPPAFLQFFCAKWAESLRYFAQTKHSPSQFTAFPRILVPLPGKPRASVCLHAPGVSRQRDHAVSFMQQSGARGRCAGLFVCDTPPHHCLIPDTLPTLFKQDSSRSRRRPYGRMPRQASVHTLRSGSPDTRLAIANPNPPDICDHL